MILIQNKVFGPAEQSLEKCFFNRILSVVILTAMLAFDLSQERLIGFALLGPRREKLTETTMHARAKVRAQPLTGSECLEG